MYVVAFPASDKTIIAMRQSLEQLSRDSIMNRYIDDIARLRMGEMIVIRNVYLIVRVG